MAGSNQPIKSRSTARPVGTGPTLLDAEPVRITLPADRSLEVEQEGKWKAFELYTTDRCDTRANQYNVVHPVAPLKCDAIRIKMTPKETPALASSKCRSMKVKESLWRYRTNRL